MKNPILSIRQPYAFAIAVGAKDIENRTWATGLRGPFYIHAGVREESADVEGVLRQIAHQWGVDVKAVRDLYADNTASKRGGIVAKATLADCVTKSASGWFNGPYGFVIKDAITLPRIILCRGQLGFFEVAGVPDLHGDME